MTELNAAIAQGSNGKAAGKDKIQNEMLKHLGYKAKVVMLDLVNEGDLTGQVPAILKEAIIIPLLKDRKLNNELSSYRPVSLTSVLAKTIEVMINRLLFHWQPHPLQFAYRKNCSTEDVLAYLILVSRA